MFRNIGRNEEVFRLCAAAAAGLAALKLPMDASLRNVLKIFAVGEMATVMLGYSPLNHVLGVDNATPEGRIERLRQRVGLSHLQRQARMKGMKRRVSRAMQLS